MLDADVVAWLQRRSDEGAAPVTHGSMEDMRAHFAEQPKPAPDQISRVEDHLIAGPGGDLRLRLYADSARHDLPVVMFFHGGGWILSDVDVHDPLPRRLASIARVAVVAVDFRLAPEHPFPAAHDDCWAATRWIIEHGSGLGIDSTRVAVCGDSSGGNLSVGVAVQARDDGFALRSQVLIYPALDPEQSFPSVEELGIGYYLEASDYALAWSLFLPEEHRNNPYAVPFNSARLDGLPPALVVTAAYDPLRDEGEEYGRRLWGAGVEATVTRYPGVVHGFVLRWDQMRRAHEAHNEIADFLHRTLDVLPL